MPAAKMIRFHKSAQDGWLQKQFFVQRCISGSALLTKFSRASHTQPLYLVRGPHLYSECPPGRLESSSTTVHYTVVQSTAQSVQPKCNRLACCDIGELESRGTTPWNEALIRPQARFNWRIILPIPSFCRAKPAILGSNWGPKRLFSWQIQLG